MVILVAPPPPLFTSFSHLPRFILIRPGKISGSENFHWLSQEVFLSSYPTQHMFLKPSQRRSIPFRSEWTSSFRLEWNGNSFPVGMEGPFYSIQKHHLELANDSVLKLYIIMLNMKKFQWLADISGEN